MLGFSIYKGNVTMELGRTPQKVIELTIDKALDAALVLEQQAGIAEMQEFVNLKSVVSFGVDFDLKRSRVFIMFGEPASGSIPMPPTVARRLAKLLESRAGYAQLSFLGR